MNKLDIKELSSVYGGDIKKQVADLGCLGVGLSFGLVNPIFGAIMGIGCGLAVYYS